jgi:hypothetical protein
MRGTRRAAGAGRVDDGRMRPKSVLFSELSGLFDSEIAPTLHVSQGTVAAYFAEMIRGWPDVSCSRLCAPKTCATWADALQIAIGSVPRSGAGRAGLEGTLNSLRTGGAKELPGRKVESLPPRCLTTAPRPLAEDRDFPQVRKGPARPAGFEPATRCLEGSRSIRLSYGRSRRPLCTEKVTRRLRASRSVSR